MRDWALLIRSLAWPIVALTAMATFRLELVGIFSAIKRQIENAKRFKGRAFGASFELASEVTQRFVQNVSKSDGPATESETEEFARKVHEYENFNDPDARTRAKLRHPLADRLGTLAVSLGLKRLELANGSEGQLVALATAIVLHPLRGDLAAIEKAAAKVTFKYTAYRLVLALISVIPTVALNKRTLQRLEAILANIAANARAADDPALHSIIESTKDEIENHQSEFQG